MDSAINNEGNNSQSIAAKSAALLLIIGEPFTEDHKKLILDEVTKGFGCWETETSGIDINDELAQIANKADLGEEGPEGERVIRHLTENFVTEILVNPQINTVTNAVKHFLATPTKHKHLIYAGHAFQGSGAWILQDDTYTANNFVQAFKDQDVSNSLKQQDGSSLYIYTSAGGDWSDGCFTGKDFAKVLKIKVNPREGLDNVNGVLQFTAYVSNFVKIRKLNDLLQSTDVVGNIRFGRPTLYIFPGCQGDSALFGLSGFNLLVNGGYSRKACFWDFTRHLDRIDAALVTHLGADNLFGFSSVLQRKSKENVHPEIGYMYINASDKIKALTDQEQNATKELSLSINLAEEGNKLIQYAKQIGQLPQPCTRNQTIEPINLYHKVGIGSMDMYILNPITDSKELKEFYQQWNQKVAQFGTSQHVPLPNNLSVCALLVWRPSDPNDNITRIFFPGNAPQHKVLEGLEKLKTLNILKSSKCTQSLLNAKPAAKKPAGLASKAPVRSKVSPVQTPKSETAVKAEPIKKASASTVSKPRPSAAQKAKKDDSNKKTSKVTEKISKNDEKTDKTKSSASSSPSKSSLKSSAASTPKETSSPTKESEPASVEKVPDLIETGDFLQNQIPNGDLEKTPVQQEPAQPIVDDLIGAPLPPQELVQPGQNEVMDKEKLKELGIYDEDQDIEDDLNQQNDQPEADRVPQMFGGMADSIHEDLIGDIGSANPMQSSFHGDMMTGSMHESMYDDKQLFDGFAQNGGTIEEVVTPEDDTSEEIQPQALPEPLAYAPSSYGQEPDVIPNVAVKEEPGLMLEKEASPTTVEPDIVPVPDDFSTSQEAGEESTMPIEDKLGMIATPQLETPDEVENTLPEDEDINQPCNEEIQEKDIIEHNEKEPVGIEDQVTDVDKDTEVFKAEDLDKHEVDQTFDPYPHIKSDEMKKEPFDDDSLMQEEITEDDLMPTDTLEQKVPEIDLLAETCKSTEQILESDDVNESLSTQSQQLTDDLLQSGEIEFDKEGHSDQSLEPELAEPVSANEQNDALLDLERPKSPEPSEAEQEAKPAYLDDEDIPREGDSNAIIESEEPPVSSAIEVDMGDQIVSDMIENDYISEDIKQEVKAESDFISEDIKQEVKAEKDFISEDIKQEVKAENDFISEDIKQENETENYISEEVKQEVHQEKDLISEEIQPADSHLLQNAQPSSLMVNSAEEVTSINKEEDIPVIEHDEEQIKLEIDDKNAEIRPLTPDSQRSGTPDSQLGAGEINRDSLEKEVVEDKGVNENLPVEQRDSIEREIPSKEESPELPDEQSEPRDSIERSFEDDSDDSEDDDDEDDEDDDEESSSFEQEENTDEKLLIQDSISEEQKILNTDDSKAHETDSLAAPPDSLLDQPSDNLISPASENMYTPESEITDQSHGGQLGYHQMGDQEDADSFDGLDDKSELSPQQPPLDPVPIYDQQHSGPLNHSTNPFDLPDKPGYNPFTEREQEQQQDLSSDEETNDIPTGGPAEFNPAAEWGEPMGLPSPAPPEDKNTTAARSPRPKSATKTVDSKKKEDPKKSEPKSNGTVKKTEMKKPDARKSLASKAPPKASNGEPEKAKSKPTSANARLSAPPPTTGRMSLGARSTTKTRPTSAPVKDKGDTSFAKTNGTKRPATAAGTKSSTSTVKMPPLPPFTPFYLDLTYIPNHGNTQYSDVEFFKRVRARYYVLSTLSPNTAILDALLDAKNTWEDKDLPVTIIPTYDNETLRLWMALHKDKLADQKVEIAPSASRCTIQLQDHETSCSAFRLEF